MEAVVHYLSREEVVILHRALLEKFGGLRGVRDLGLLESAIARPKAGMRDIEAYPDILMKAAVLGHSLIKNHSFIDGNKRTGIAAMLYFLRKNEVKLVIQQGELLKLGLEIAEGYCKEQDITSWLNQHLQD